jgi:uncharacterized protein YdeI (YjbR/CyaY-like superfamily)
LDVPYLWTICLKRMNIGKILYIKNRKEWRTWLAKSHRTASEIWLIYYKKQSGKPRIPYNDAVEEALCYGWIDSILKPIDEQCFAQRFSPRRKSSKLSEMNKERIRRLTKAKKMTRFGLDSIRHHLENKPKKSAGSQSFVKFTFPQDILKILKANPAAWKNFKNFPLPYKRIRVGWIDAARQHPEIFNQRLKYFLKMTIKNKKFGMVQ